MSFIGNFASAASARAIGKYNSSVIYQEAQYVRKKAEVNKKVFDKQGYLLIEDIIPSVILAPTRRMAINLKRDKISELGKPREHGTGTYWRGIEMASKLEEELMFSYLHPFMQQIVPVFMETTDIWITNMVLILKVL